MQSLKGHICLTQTKSKPGRMILLWWATAAALELAIKSSCELTRSESGGGDTGSGDFYHDAAAAGVKLDQTRCPKKGIKVHGV